jgi:hypothetical protein
MQFVAAEKDRTMDEGLNNSSGSVPVNWLLLKSTKVRMTLLLSLLLLTRG